MRHCEPRLAYFAVPRYLEFLDELPLTENGKVRKFVLRERGVTADGLGPRGRRLRAEAVTVAVIAGAAESPYTRHPDPATTTTESLLADAFLRVLAATGIERAEVDGLGVASFTLAPDHAIDLAWRLGLRVRWLMDDANGGAAGINMLQHAARAIEAGDASTIVLLAGDRLLREEFAASSTATTAPRRPTSRRSPSTGRTRDFALLTQRHMAATGLTRADYGRIAVAQRRWAAGNPLAVYREPLTLEEYLAAPLVAEPLCRYDCVPVVSGADALVVTSARPRGGRRPDPRDPRAPQPGRPGGRRPPHRARGDRPELWAAAAAGPDEIDLAWIYDDYPAMVLVQLDGPRLRRRA